jgi:hypothetical protein
VLWLGTVLVVPGLFYLSPATPKSDANAGADVLCLDAQRLKAMGAGDGATLTNVLSDGCSRAILCS